MSPFRKTVSHMDAQGSILEGLSKFSHVFGHMCRELAENSPRSCAACGPSIAKLLWPHPVGPRSSERGLGGGGPPRGVTIK